MKHAVSILNTRYSMEDHALLRTNAQHALTLFLLLLVSIPVVQGQAKETPASTDASSAAPDQSTSEGIQKRWNEFGIWGGISFDSPISLGLGTTPNARFGSIGLRYGRVLAASKSVAFEWTIDAVPIAILSNDRFAFLPSSLGGFTVTHTRKSVYAFGASPVRLKANFRRNRRVQPFGSTTGGFLYFREDVPVAGAARFNFTFDFSGGVQIVNRQNGSDLTAIGYMLGPGPGQLVRHDHGLRCRRSSAADNRCRRQQDVIGL